MHQAMTRDIKSGVPVEIQWFKRQAGWLRRVVAPALTLVFCAFLLWLFQHLSQTINYHLVLRSLRSLPAGIWGLALLTTALSYLALVARDAVGLRYLGARIPSAALWIGATVGSALGNATGFGALTGGAVRCRVYGAYGIKPTQVGKLTLFTSITLALSLALMTSVGLLGAAPALGHMINVPSTVLRAGGAVILAAVALLIICCRRVPRQLHVRWFALDIPSRRDLLAQLGFAAIDVSAAGLTLWVLLPHGELGFAHFIAIFAAAMLLGIIGHTPGGLGVFEASMVFALGASVPTPAMVAALLAYRAIYFGVPLLLSALLLAGFESRAFAARLSIPRPRRIGQLAPTFLGIITFVAGGLQVISSATPSFGHRLALLRTILPLWMVESSQVLASVLGVLLLFVARGLMRRLDAAWWLALGLAAVSLVLSLTKGLAFVEASLLTVLIVLLAMTRDRFRRASSLFAERFTGRWLVSVGIVLLVAVWVFFFAFREVPYSGSLWFEFAFDSRASRALRAIVGAALFAAALALWQLLRPAPGRVAKPAYGDLCDAGRIIRAQERSDAGLAMMGDKSFLFSTSRNAFLMYAKNGRTWAALHDPVGPRDEWAQLISRFIALAHEHGGRAAFYQVRGDALPFYLDAGLSLMKLGEEAHIDLSDFDLAGSHRSHLRYALKRGERDGLSVETIAPARIAELLPSLRAISEAWMGCRAAKEKSFSVASFSNDYLATQSVMLVRQHGAPVAFVTFMTTDLNTEATIGVMRHLSSASAYTMEYLFTQLALHLKQTGLLRLSLGVAPLSGMTPTPLASFWYRLAGLIWHVGERFYNFRGLRIFKSKFQPRWEPRYLAVSGTVGVLFTLADLSLLAGGKRS